MKVKDFLKEEAFIVKDTKNGCKPIDIQINIFGETMLSDKYGECEVLKNQLETDSQIWPASYFGAEEESRTLVLYI